MWIPVLWIASCVASFIIGFFVAALCAMGGRASLQEENTALNDANIERVRPERMDHLEKGAKIGKSRERKDRS